MANNYLADQASAHDSISRFGRTLKLRRNGVDRDITGAIVRRRPAERSGSLFQSTPRVALLSAVGVTQPPDVELDRLIDGAEILRLLHPVEKVAPAGIVIFWRVGCEEIGFDELSEAALAGIDLSVEMIASAALTIYGAAALNIIAALDIELGLNVILTRTVPLGPASAEIEMVMAVALAPAGIVSLTGIDMGVELALTANLGSFITLPAAPMTIEMAAAVTLSIYEHALQLSPLIVELSASAALRLSSPPIDGAFIGTHIDDAFSGINFTFPAVPIGSANAARHVIVIVAARDGSNLNRAITGVTIGGAPATAIVNSPSQDLCMGIFMAAQAAGATADITVTFNGNMSNFSGIGIAVWAINKIGLTALDSAYVTSTGGFATLDVADNGIMLGARSAPTSTIGDSITGMTELFNETISNVSRPIQWVGGHLTPTTEPTNTASMSPGRSGSRAVYASFAP